MKEAHWGAYKVITLIGIMAEGRTGNDEGFGGGIFRNRVSCATTLTARAPAEA